jgi:hypothetical protein
LTALRIAFSTFKEQRNFYGRKPQWEVKFNKRKDNLFGECVKTDTAVPSGRNMLQKFVKLVAHGLGNGNTTPVECRVNICELQSV